MTDLELASYIDRGLSSRDRDRIESHLAECVECRNNLTQAQGLVERTRRPRLAIAAGALTVAAAALFVIRPATLAVDSPRERNGTAAGADLIAAHMPVGEAPDGSRQFVWGSVRGASSYRLTLSSADGAPVWSHTGRDTVATLPHTIELQRGASYAWVVDVLVGDGSTRSTGLTRFKTTR